MLLQDDLLIFFRLIFSVATGWSSVFLQAVLCVALGIYPVLLQADVLYGYRLIHCVASGWSPGMQEANISRCYRLIFYNATGWSSPFRQADIMYCYRLKFWVAKAGLHMLFQTELSNVYMRISCVPTKLNSWFPTGWYLKLQQPNLLWCFTLIS